MSWEEDYLMQKVGELEQRLAVVEGRVDVQEPILAPEQAAEPDTDYSNWTVKQLAAEIEARNTKYGTDLATTGNKGDLVARLVEDDKETE